MKIEVSASEGFVEPTDEWNVFLWPVPGAYGGDRGFSEHRWPPALREGPAAPLSDPQS